MGRLRRTPCSRHSAADPRTRNREARLLRLRSQYFLATRRPLRIRHRGTVRSGQPVLVECSSTLTYAGASSGCSVRSAHLRRSIGRRRDPRPHGAQMAHHEGRKADGPDARRLKLLKPAEALRPGRHRRLQTGAGSTGRRSIPRLANVLPGSRSRSQPTGAKRRPLRPTLRDPGERERSWNHTARGGQPGLAPPTRSAGSGSCSCSCRRAARPTCRRNSRARDRGRTPRLSHDHPRVPQRVAGHLASAGWVWA